MKGSYLFRVGPTPSSRIWFLNGANKDPETQERMPYEASGRDWNG